MELSHIDPCRRRHRGASTSVQAWQRCKDGLTMMQKEVFEIIQRMPEGATCDQVAQMLGVGVNSVSGRFTELKRNWLIRDTGQRRITRSGNWAKVYAAYQEVVQLKLF